MTTALGPEKANNDNITTSENDIARLEASAKSSLKLDNQGLPLVPQPSDHPDDPLNYSRWFKVYIAVLISGLAFMAQLGSALINPAFREMAKDLDVTVEQASYSTTVFILFGGVLSMFIVPFANVYGRRICYIIFIVIAVAGAFVSAAAPTYGGVITGRVFNGIGGSVPLGIGAATICDLFPQGGYIAEQLGWRWCFWIPGIIQAAMWIVLLFTLPETLFSRKDHSMLEQKSYVQKLLFHGRVLDRKVHARDFLGSLRMARYAAVLLPSIWYMTANTYGSALFAVTGSQLAASVFHFDLPQTGLYMGVPLSIGCIIGEATAGWVSDAILNAYARRHEGYRKPEVRLYLIPLTTLLAIGTATYGYCIQTHRHWIDASVCMAISGLGTQVGTTMVYTYATDSYKPQSGEIGAVINLFKSVFAFNVGFYALPFGLSAGFDTAFSILAAINLALLLPLFLLVWKGEKIREWQGTPKDHADL
ncbi:hypothetical protein B0A55_10998 [Friedmanniomyces simplex]|uniref:Major facilitator superfamily (MFS) profile domain-containing protein n=1 Tax=Friedmanniomyces simplex TaxID=329884 RepID=A0A4U0W5E9_9PEZI|nr:hypothetical protein B0A55_10998 [Friedmanniomyces simplex]